VLEYALRTMSFRKREKLDQSARAVVPDVKMKGGREKLDQTKLELLMKEDPKIAEMM
jgi:hypothetical protein